MNKNKLIVRSLSLFVFFLVALAIYQRANEGVSGLLWGWKDALPFDQAIDISAVGATFGVYDNEQKFAEAELLAIEHIFVSWLDDNSALIATKSKYASERNRWLLLTIEPWAKEEGVASSDTLFADIATDNNVPLEIAPKLVEIFQDGAQRFGSREFSPNIIKRLEEATGLDIRADGFPADISDDEPEERGYEVGRGLARS